MFGNYVELVLFWDTVIALIPLLFSLLFFGILLCPKQNLPKKSAAAMAFFCLVLAVLWFYVQFPFFHDCIHYLRYGDTYVMETECRLTEVYWPGGRENPSLNVHFICADGRKFVAKYRSDYSRLSDQWVQANQNLLIYHLPHSHLILKAIPIE